MENYAFHLMPYRDSDDPAWPFLDDPWDPELGHQYLNEYFDQLELADELEFDAVGVNEHHFSTHSTQVAPNLSAAHLAARTDDVDLALLGNIIGARRNPIRVAEEIAWLDNLTGGRIISGFPRGIPPEFLAASLNFEESRSRMEEAWELIEKAWTEDEPFDWNGDHYQFEKIFVRPKPYQDPHPELWMPAESDESHHFAADKQLPIGSPFHKSKDMAEFFQNYRDIAETEYNWTPQDKDFTVLRHIYVAESTEKAYEEAEEHLRHFFRHSLLGLYLGVLPRFMGHGFYDPEHHDVYIDNLTGYGVLAHEYDFKEYLDEGVFIVGEPEEAVAEIERQYEELGGFGRFAGLFQFGDMPHNKAVKNMELYADEVMSEVSRM